MAQQSLYTYKSRSEKDEQALDYSLRLNSIPQTI